MRNRLLLLAIVILSCAPFLKHTFAAPEETWIGEIGDSSCKFEHVSVAEGEPVLPSPECVKACVRGGNKYVPLVDDKLFNIENQTHPDLNKFAGKMVRMTG